MKTSVKKALSFFMAVAVMLSCITITPVSVSASEYEIGALVDSGNCGAVGSETSVKWELTKNGTNDQGEDTYTITIKGNGAMYDYNTDVAYPEWSNTEEKRGNITKVVIGYGVTRIGNDSFYGCIKVEEVVFERNENGESSVTAIGDYVFVSNGKLTSIVIPASVEGIGDYAFETCSSLTSLVFEESGNLTTIGSHAFAGVKSLEEYIIPSKVESFGNYAFGNNSALKRFYYPSIVNDFGTEVFRNAASLDYFGKYTVNDTAKTCSVNYIGLDTTEWRPKDTIVPTATEIIIPEKLDGYEVVQATISDNTVDIPKSFEADHTATKISDVEALEGWAYEAETDELPAGGSVEVTATYHVGETQKLTKTITVSRAACADSDKDHKCDGGCGKTFGDCVDANKDHKCDYGCSKVTAHTWDKGVVTKKATATAKGEKTYTCTFCKATKKEEIAALGLPKKGSKYTSDDGKAKYKITKSDAKKGTVSFVAPANKKSTTVTIPSTVKIKGVTFKVTAIEKNAFKSNKKVKNVTIGKNVTTIGESAFYKCTALTKITIPSKVTTIGKKAFYGCSKLKKLTIKSSKLTEKKIGSKAFSKTPKSMKVTVPKKKFKTYKSMLIKKGVNKKAKFVKG